MWLWYHFFNSFCHYIVVEKKFQQVSKILSLFEYLSLKNTAKEFCINEHNMKLENEVLIYLQSQLDSSYSSSSWLTTNYMTIPANIP